MAKQAYVWDATSSSWVALGVQVPTAPYSQKFGSDSITVTASPTAKSVTFATGSFTSTPKMSLQVTSDVDARIVVSAVSSTGFTAKVYGPTSGTVNFDWYAIQPSV
jgi:hypothetical protein